MTLIPGVQEVRITIADFDGETFPMAVLSKKVPSWGAAQTLRVDMIRLLKAHGFQETPRPGPRRV